MGETGGAACRQLAIELRGTMKVMLGSMRLESNI
jgi:hypothetical protein